MKQIKSLLNIIVRITFKWGMVGLPNWGEVQGEIFSTPNPLKKLRKEYLEYMFQYTDRNVIAYYSAFLQKKDISQVGIDDNDKNAFMQTVCGLDRKKGLDLILHTPGGQVAATESIVTYLKKMFSNDIRVFVPQMAMSAGTMIALSSKEIIMGKQSNLGPIDPQFGGMSCSGIIEEFDNALDAVKNDPSSASIWGLIINKYHPTFLGDCNKAILWSNEIVKKWLEANMFRGFKDKSEKAEKVVSFLSNHGATYSHDRHIHIDELKKLGLKVEPLENLDNREIGRCKDLQDCVLTLHHVYMQSLTMSNILKIVENQKGADMSLSIGKPQQK